MPVFPGCQPVGALGLRQLKSSRPDRKVVQVKDWVLYRLDCYSLHRQSLELKKHSRVTRFRFTPCRLPFGGRDESQTFEWAKSPANSTS